MAKYKLTVKYNDICDLSIAGDIPDIIGNEFDQYVKSMLFKKEEWENFETSFKQAANEEYGNIGQNQQSTADNKEETSPIEAETPPETPTESPCTDDAPVFIEDEASIDNLPDIQKQNEEPPIEDNKETEPEKNQETDTAQHKEETTKTPAKAETPAKKEKPKTKILSFEDYIKNKNINTPLDEFVVGACYLDEILNIKKFSLKQLNSKLYPAFGRLASSNIINEAIERVLIETIKESKTTQYSINENAWNYHNYDLVRH